MDCVSLRWSSDNFNPLRILPCPNEYGHHSPSSIIFQVAGRYLENYDRAFRGDKLGTSSNTWIDVGSAMSGDDAARQPINALVLCCWRRNDRLPKMAKVEVG